MAFLIFMIPIYIISVLICGFFAKKELKKADCQIFTVMLMVVICIFPFVNTVVAIATSLVYLDKTFKWSSQQGKFIRK